MGISNLLTIIFGLLSLVGPISVFSKNIRSRKNTFLFLMSIVTGPIWAISIALFFKTENMITARISANIVYTVSVVVAVLTYYFTKNFPYKSSGKFLEKFLLFLPALYILYTVWFTDSFIIYLDSTKIPKFGIVYLFWVIWFVSVIGSRIIILIKNLKQITEIERRQTAYLVVGLILGGVGMIPFNIVLPYIGVYRYIWIGPIMGFVMISSISYGVSTLRFGNVKIWVRSVLLFFVYAVIPSILISYLLCYLFQLRFAPWVLLLLIFSNIFYYYLVGVIKERLIGSEDPSEILSKKIATILGLKEVCEEILSFVTLVLKPKFASLLIVNNQNEVSYIYGSKSSNSTENFPSMDVNSYGTYFKEQEKMVVLQELKHLQITSIEEQNIWRYKRFLSLKEYMENALVHVIIPVRLSNNYQGFLLLGPKDRGDMYIAGELKFLLTIRNTVRVLLERGLLYQEVERFNISLQQKVNEQTQELQIKVRELQEARRKESDMIDIMGHELRTPATVVKLNVALLEKYINSNPKEFKKYLDRIKQAVETEISLINTLLTSAKLEGDKIEVKREKVDIKEEIEMSVHGHIEEVNSKTKLVSNVPRGIGYVYADRVRVAEILNNLISNAVKYTKQGTIIVSAEASNSNIRISVKDTGVGISKEDLDRIGEKFFRVGHYLESDIVRPGGTGLGLYITFKLARLMGGDIKVKSQVNKGTTFTLTLPKYIGQYIDSSQDSLDRFRRLGLKK